MRIAVPIRARARLTLRGTATICIASEMNCMATIAMKRRLLLPSILCSMKPQQHVAIWAIAQRGGENLS
jgi:hypothetical protein